MKDSTLTTDSLKLIEALQNKKINAEDLTSRQRKKVVLYFLENQSDESNVAIGRLLGITNQAVGQIKKQLLKESAWEIEDVDIKMLAVSLKKKKEEYQRRAVGKDVRLAWQIEMDYIEKMQSLGFVYKAPEKIQGNFTHTLSMTDFKQSFERMDDIEDGLLKVTPKEKEEGGH